jgi:hypothetical protein
MRSEIWAETTVEQKITYAMEVGGKLVVVENVPARMSLETGERFFTPETVERLQQTVWRQRKPSRVVRTPVSEFASQPLARNRLTQTDDR